MQIIDVDAPEDGIVFANAEELAKIPFVVRAQERLNACYLYIYRDREWQGISTTWLMAALDPSARNTATVGKLLGFDRELANLGPELYTLTLRVLKTRYFVVYSKRLDRASKVTGIENLARLLKIPQHKVPQAFMLKVAFGEGDDEQIVVETHGP